jgi:hypothetical protein
VGRQHVIYIVKNGFKQYEKRKEKEEGMLTLSRRYNPYNFVGMVCPFH